MTTARWTLPNHDEAKPPVAHTPEETLSASAKASGELATKERPLHDD
jgi:inorganic pyrophosphatase